MAAKYARTVSAGPPEGAADEPGDGVTCHSAACELKPDAGVHCTLVARTPSGSSKETQPTRLPPGCSRTSPAAKLVPAATELSDEVYAWPSDPVTVASLFAFSSM